MPIFSKVRDILFKGSASVKRKKIYHNVLLNDPQEIWSIMGEIGDGAYGKVYKAQNIANGTLAALKKVSLEEEEDLDNFMVEIDILAESQHNNIVRLLEAYHWDGCLWMYLEYCDGGAVDTIMVDLDRPLLEPQIAYICYHLLHALDYIHHNKVIHRDVKAGNVLLTTEGGVKLADFGVSAKNKNTMDKRGTFIGTPYWLAPEVIKCETFIDSKYDYKADIWSLGITLIEFAQMDPPNHDVSPLRVLLKIQKSDPPKLDCPSRFSKEFNDFIAACLVKEPEKRPDSRDLLRHPFMSGSHSAKHIIALLIEYQADVVEEDVEEDHRSSRLSIDSEDQSSTSQDLSVGDLRSTKEVTPTGVMERRASKGPAPPPPGQQKKGPAPSAPTTKTVSPTTATATTPTSVPAPATIPTPSHPPTAVSRPIPTTASSPILASTPVSVSGSISAATSTISPISASTPTTVSMSPSTHSPVSVAPTLITAVTSSSTPVKYNIANSVPVTSSDDDAFLCVSTSVPSTPVLAVVTSSQNTPSIPSSLPFITSTPLKEVIGKQAGDPSERPDEISATIPIVPECVGRLPAPVSSETRDAGVVVVTSSPDTAAGLSDGASSDCAAVVSNINVTTKADTVAPSVNIPPLTVLSDAATAVSVTPTRDSSAVIVSPIADTTAVSVTPAGAASAGIASQDASMVSITTLGLETVTGHSASVTADKVQTKEQVQLKEQVQVQVKEQQEEEVAASKESSKSVIIEATSKTRIVSDDLPIRSDDHEASTTVVSIVDNSLMSRDVCDSESSSVMMEVQKPRLPTLVLPLQQLSDESPIVLAADYSLPCASDDQVSFSSTPNSRKSAEDRQRLPDSSEPVTPDLSTESKSQNQNEDRLRTPPCDTPLLLEASGGLDASGLEDRSRVPEPLPQIIASIGSEGTVILRTPTPTPPSSDAVTALQQQLQLQNVVTFSGPGVVESPSNSPRDAGPQSMELGGSYSAGEGGLDFSLTEEEAVQLLDDVIDHHAGGGDSITSIESYTAPSAAIMGPATAAIISPASAAIMSPASAVLTSPATAPGAATALALALAASNVVVTTEMEEAEIVVVSDDLDQEQVIISNSSILEGESNTDDITLPRGLLSAHHRSQHDAAHISVVSVAEKREQDTLVTIEGTTLGDTDVDSLIQSKSHPSGLHRLSNGSPAARPGPEDRSDSDSVSTVSSEKENSKPRRRGSTSEEEVVLRRTGRTVSGDTTASIASNTARGDSTATMQGAEDASLRPIDRNRQNRQANILRNGRTKEENESLALRKKTRKRTRKFMIDGVVVTTTTSKVIYGDDEDGNIMISGHLARKQELRELKILQKLEQKQFQELGIKSGIARQEQERKFDSEKSQLIRSYDNDVDMLNRHQKQQVERTEAQHEIELKAASKKIRGEQERDLRAFRESLKTELKLLKQEVDLLAKDYRKESLRIRKDHLESDQTEREKAFLDSLHQSHESSMKRLSEEHRSHVALLERQFLQKKHQLLRAREAALWELEERHLHDRHQLAKRQLKDIFFLQRHQMLLRHEKELEQVRRQNTNREEELVKRQQVERRSMPKRIRAEMKARELMFRESMRISVSTLPESHYDEKERLRKFQDNEKRRYEAEKKRGDQKHKRQLEELQAATEAHAKELEQLQNEKRKMLMEHETLKLKAQEEEYQKELREWKNNLKPRKQRLEEEFEQQLMEQQQFYGTYLTDSAVFVPAGSLADPGAGRDAGGD